MMASALILYLVGASAAAAAKLPANFIKCKRMDPNLNDCLENAVQEAIPELVKGVRSLGIPPIDPLRVSQLEFGDESRGSVSLHLKFKDLEFRNIGNATVTKVEADLDNYKITVELKINEPLVFEGDFESRGRILVLPMDGKGRLKVTLDKVKAVATLQGREKMKEGRKFMDLTDFQVDFQTDKLNHEFTQLSDQDKILGETFTKFIDDNWDEVLHELKPLIRKALGGTFMELAKRVFDKVPYDDIFLS